jgi:hypothetical protein
MNKKVLFLAAGVLLATGSFAQKDKMKEASKELKKAQEAKTKTPPDEAATREDYQKAKEAIDAATTHADTKDNADAWFTKAAVYIGMQDQSELNADQPYREGIVAIKRAFELNKKLENNDQAPMMLANAAFFAYNDGIQHYNNSKFSEAYEYLKSGADILGPDKDRRFITIPIIDTIRAQTKMFMGFTAFYAQNYDAAIPLLKEMQTSPYVANESNVYLILAEAYKAKGNKEQQLAVIREAKKKFPDDKNVAAAELNYFIESGKQEEITSKLEEAAANDPQNPELQLNMGIVYSGMAVGDKVTEAQAKEFNSKAEAAYKKAVALAPNNGVYNYQLGAYYYNQAAEINGEMNNLGVSKAEQLKYEELLQKRNALFALALPALEKSNEAFSARPNKLSGEERKYFFNCLSALKEIYVIQDDNEKAKAVRTKLEAMQ